MLPCPAKLPHDLEVGAKLACWFHYPFNSWLTGKILEVNKRRCVTENVLLQFTTPAEGETTALLVADPATYGVDTCRLWVALKPIPVDVGGSSSSPSDDGYDDESQ